MTSLLWAMGSTLTKTIVPFLKSIMSRPLIRPRDRGWKFIILCPQPCFAQPQPEDTLLFRDGELLFSKGEVEKALWRFKKIVTDHPQSSLLNEAKFRMGLCYTQLKRPREAIRI